MMRDRFRTALVRKLSVSLKWVDLWSMVIGLSGTLIAGFAVSRHLLNNGSV